MKPVERQKICSQCDGRIPVDALQCLYCGSDVTKLSEPPTSFSKHQALEDSLTSLYKPQYNNSKSSGSAASYAAAPLASETKHPEETKKYKEVAPMASSIVPEEIHEEGVKEIFWAIFALSLGSILLMLGLLQLFFSDNGKLVLEWNAKYWFMYAALSLPAIYFGLRKLGRK